MDRGEEAALFAPDTLLRWQDRAERAAATGAESFAIPEAAGVARHLARTSPIAALRDAAARWPESGARYHDLVRLAAQTVLAREAIAPAAESVYVPKAAGELEPMLALWPAVLAVPTTASLTAAALIELRAFPVHPLGLVDAVSWADGRPCSPAEYFFHDLDHARYKIREDLRVGGIDVPDPYVAGTTWDESAGRHRVVLGAAAGRIGSRLWQRAPAGLALARRLLAHAAGLLGAQGEAAALLLFEIVHEKSVALTPEALARALADDVHTRKIVDKRAAGFYGTAPPSDAVVAALDNARLGLGRAL